MNDDYDHGSGASLARGDPITACSRRNELFSACVSERIAFGSQYDQIYVIVTI